MSVLGLLNIFGGLGLISIGMARLRAEEERQDSVFIWCYVLFRPNEESSGSRPHARRSGRDIGSNVILRGSRRGQWLSTLEILV